VVKQVFCSLLVLSAIAYSADFKAGLEAYDRADYATAFQEWQPIAERGDANAEYNVALMYALGQGTAQDYQKAAEWYRKAAEQGVAAAQYNLAVLYTDGQGVGQDKSQAIQWFLKAVEKGIQDAELGLGQLYYDTKNYPEAEKWYRKAAERGVPSAAFHLGVMYDLGDGVPNNYAEAMQWYTKAANQGYAPALTNLGILYYNAEGVKRDLVQAYIWFARADKMGDSLGSQLLHTTTERMKAKDVKTAQAQVDQWQPSSPAPSKPDEAKLFKQPETSPAGTATGSADRAAPDQTVTQPDPH